MTLESSKNMLRDSDEKYLFVWKKDIYIKNLSHVKFLAASQFQACYDVITLESRTPMLRDSDDDFGVP